MGPVDGDDLHKTGSVSCHLREENIAKSSRCTQGRYLPGNSSKLYVSGVLRVTWHPLLTTNYERTTQSTQRCRYLLASVPWEANARLPFQ